MERRIYSVNTVAYIKMVRPDINIITKKDKEKKGLVYFVIDEDVSELISDYKNNKVIQKFIGAYKDVREMMSKAE